MSSQAVRTQQREFDRLPSPKWFIGGSVLVRGWDGSLVPSKVEGLTCAGPNSEHSPGYLYLVQSETGARWVHESLLELGHTAGFEDGEQMSLLKLLRG